MCTLSPSAANGLQTICVDEVQPVVVGVAIVAICRAVPAYASGSWTWRRAVSGPW